jgi:Zn-dependent M28 family amino/carboxypeptidase
MKKVILALFVVTTSLLQAQNIDKIINAKEVERIEKTLSADDMQGRKTFSEGIENSGSYLQEFTMVKPKFLSVSGSFENMPLESKDVIVITSKAELAINEKSGFEIVSIKAGANIFSEASKFIQAGKNYLVVVDTSFAKNFSRLTGFKRQLFKSENSVVFVLSTQQPKVFSISAKHEITEQKLSNVIGVIPGKSKKNEYVIFSGHYDHLGIGKAVNNDSIYNGANDDAAGTTAMIMLSKYFKEKKDNERTLIFVAFTAEEIGGFGAQYCSRQFNALDVKAMFNIEMIGTESKWGKNSAYITGYEKTDMGKILQENLNGTGFTFYPDPYTDQNLFYRSDNATLARLGVPAHTISTSKMDSEPNYHKVSDEIGTLDMDNMAMIIKAIALSSKGIISGKDTPSRVDVSGLK